MSNKTAFAWLAPGTIRLAVIVCSARKIPASRNVPSPREKEEMGAIVRPVQIGQPLPRHERQIQRADCLRRAISALAP